MSFCGFNGTSNFRQVSATAIAPDKTGPLLLEAVGQSPSSRTRITENWAPLIGAPVFLLERPVKVRFWAKQMAAQGR